jgi:hypothetical protein
MILESLVSQMRRELLTALLLDMLIDVKWCGKKRRIRLMNKREERT